MVYTAEEHQQIKQLEDAGCKTLFETNIKEVAGGYIIAHQVSYVLDGEVKGVTREQLVAADHYAVTSVIADLYGSLENEAEATQVYDYQPTQKGNGKLQEPYYPASQHPGEELMRQAKAQAAEAHTAKEVNPKA
jgi:hypothetical protein